MTKRSRMVVENTRSRVKKSLNLPILRLINEFKGKMVNKGRIHGELGKFERYLRNSIKLEDELRLEIYNL